MKELTAEQKAEVTSVLRESDGDTFNVSDLDLTCPECTSNGRGPNFMDIVAEDIDSLNHQGSIDFQCWVCREMFTTGLLHWDEETSNV